MEERIKNIVKNVEENIQKQVKFSVTAMKRANRLYVRRRDPMKNCYKKSRQINNTQNNSQLLNMSHQNVISQNEGMLQAINHQMILQQNDRMLQAMNHQIMFQHHQLMRNRAPFVPIDQNEQLPQFTIGESQKPPNKRFSIRDRRKKSN